MVGSPCSPRDSQESSPTPQFKSIDSLVLSFLYSPTLTFIHNRSGGLVFPSPSEFSPVFVIHTVKGFGIVTKAEIDVFSGTLLLF